jgi:hypothetical protein
MAAAISEGDRVQIVDRDATADDVKTQLFYNHFRGLTGAVQTIYATGEACIEIETEALPEAIAQRHRDVQEKMKSDWLDRLSEEARNRLTSQERDFRLRYTVLVRVSDLMEPAAERGEHAGTDAPRRITEAELRAAEETELRRRQNGK